MTEQTCPPLPSGSVDFAALHAAAMKGADLNAAIVAANGGTTELTPAPVPVVEAPAVEAAAPATKK
jgi:hypothetical protein